MQDIEVVAVNYENDAEDKRVDLFDNELLFHEILLKLDDVGRCRMQKMEKITKPALL